MQGSFLMKDSYERKLIATATDRSLLIIYGLLKIRITFFVVIMICYILLLYYIWGSRQSTVCVPF